MGYKFLIADDEAIDRQALSQLLRQEIEDIEEIYTANSGVKMLEILQKQDIDIALVDIEMPGMNGLEAVRKLRQQHNSVKIIMNTAYSSFGFAVDALKLAADDYLVKPLIREKFIEAVNGCLQKIKKEKEAETQQETMLSNIRSTVADSAMRYIVEDQINANNIKILEDVLGLSQKQSVICVLTTQYERSDMLNRIVQHSKEMLPEGCDSFSYELDKERLVCLISAGKEIAQSRFEDSVYKILQSICEAVKRRFFVPCYVGVGLVANSVVELHQSYLDSLIAVANCGVKNIVFSAKKYNPEQQAQQTESNKYVRMAKNYVKIHYKEDISLESISDEIGISMYYLSRLFKEELGINFLEYLTDVRINRAIELLNLGEYSIKELALQVGYQNHTYFCKIFKKKTGKTVGEFRRKSNGE